jgi:hypothetical protein
MGGPLHIQLSPLVVPLAAGQKVYSVCNSDHLDSHFLKICHYSREENPVFEVLEWATYLLVSLYYDFSFHFFLLSHFSGQSSTLNANRLADNAGSLRSSLRLQNPSSVTSFHHLDHSTYPLEGGVVDRELSTHTNSDSHPISFSSNHLLCHQEKSCLV